MKITKEGELDLDDFKKKCISKTKIVALTYVSNVLNYKSSMDIIAIVRRQSNAIVLLMLLAAAHFPINVQTLDCDFYVFLDTSFMAY